ncbi:MAG TPA: hypothetical protein VKH37_07180, partial [Ferruginibacter sp.]|nr:hypothetical protein [Ferruginibacter sp.]
QAYRHAIMLADGLVNRRVTSMDRKVIPACSLIRTRRPDMLSRQGNELAACKNFDSRKAIFSESATYVRPTGKMCSQPICTLCPRSFALLYSLLPYLYNPNPRVISAHGP